jgi:hypothetical protein
MDAADVRRLADSTDLLIVAEVDTVQGSSVSWRESSMLDLVVRQRLMQRAGGAVAHGDRPTASILGTRSVSKPVVRQDSEYLLFLKDEGAFWALESP